MSLRKKGSSRSGLYSSAGGFSSMSLGSYTSTKASCGPYLGGPITPVVINKTLLAPLNLDIDPTVQAVRTHEKDQIKGLNNRFASFIDKVRFLEQQNKMLETKWTLLQEQTTASSNIEPMMKAYISNLRRQLDMVSNDKSRLDQENHSMHRSVDDFKTKYEEEIYKRNGTENEFVNLKKEVDAGYLCKVDLEDKVASLEDEINFLRRLYDMEVCELQESMKDTSVVVQMDNSRGLNMDQIVSEVKAQYEDIAARSRTEAESWYKVKFDQMAATADQRSSELSETKLEIAELKGLISRLQNQIHSVKAQRSTVEDQISEAEARGQNAVKDATARVGDLERALQRAKHDMAWQVREYQELMNAKLALDIEISTYRKLLEGEEERIGYQSIISIQSVPNNRPVMNGQSQHEPLWFCPVVPKKELEPEQTICYFPARPVPELIGYHLEAPSPLFKLEEPEVIVCHVPARGSYFTPEGDLVCIERPPRRSGPRSPVFKLEEPELIACHSPAPIPVVTCEEPEVPICYFPAPSSPVMKRPESPPVMKRPESPPVMKRPESPPVMKRPESPPVMKRPESPPVLIKMTEA